jgi:hypothetical protein
LADERWVGFEMSVSVADKVAVHYQGSSHVAVPRGLLVVIVVLNTFAAGVTVAYASIETFPQAVSASFIYVAVAVVVVGFACIVDGLLFSKYRRLENPKRVIVGGSRRTTCVILMILGTGFLMLGVGIFFASFGPVFDHSVYRTDAGTYYSWTSTGHRQAATVAMYADFHRRLAFVPIAVALLFGGLEQIYLALEVWIPGFAGEFIVYPISSRFGRVRDDVDARLDPYAGDNPN